MNDGTLLSVKGHVRIIDDLGNVLVDKHNAVHPQNLARIFARALAHEPQSYAWRLAYGNGGTQTSSDLTIEFNPPNTGLSPDVNTWNSTIYNETYSEIVDQTSSLIGTDPGSAGRVGGGSNPSGDPVTIPFVSGPGARSNELGLQSQVVIIDVLNPGEPTGQQTTDTFPGGTFPTGSPSDGDFVFDEIGLYTDGAPLVATSGYQNIDVGDQQASAVSGLAASTTYTFRIAVDGGSVQIITFTTPAVTGITFQQFITALLTGDATWGLGGVPAITGASIQMSGDTFNSQTFGFLTFISQTTGSGSSISVTPAQSGDAGTNCIAALNAPTGGVIDAAVPGSAAGVPNNPVQPSLQGQRLLAHITFAPVLKTSTRTLQITYTLTISVAPTNYPINP